MTFDDRIVGYRSPAAAALAQQRWGKAEQELKALVAISPDDATAWNNLGVALEHQQKNREAIEAFARAAALSPRNRRQGDNLVREMQRYLGSLQQSRSSKSSISDCISFRCQMVSARPRA